MSTTPIDGSGKGFIRLHRKLLENPLFRNKPAAWLKIWIYILLRVNWRESVFRPRQGEGVDRAAGLERARSRFKLFLRMRGVEQGPIESLAEACARS